MSHSHINGEALQLHAVYKKPYFLLQITWESVSGTASHARCIWMCNEIEGSYDKSLSPKYQAIPEKISRVCCNCHCFTRNNANGNKLVIFPNIALYFGDTYIIVQVCVIFNCAMEVLHSTVNLTKKWYKYYTNLHKLSLFNKSNYDVLYSTVYLIRKVQLKPGEIMVPELLKMKKLQWSMSPSCSAASVSKLRIVTITILALYTLTPTFCLREGTPGD